MRLGILRVLLVGLALALQGCSQVEKSVALVQKTWAEELQWHSSGHEQGKRRVVASLLQRGAEDSEQESDDEDSATEDGLTSGDADGDTTDSSENADANGDDADSSKDADADKDASDGSTDGDADSDDATSKNAADDAVADAFDAKRDKDVGTKDDSGDGADDAKEDSDDAADELEPASDAGSNAGSKPVRSTSEQQPSLRGGGEGIAGGRASTSKKEHDPAAEYAALVQRHASKQQAELNDQYEKMLYLSDPDDIDKAMKLAWMKMEYEDQKFTGAMAKRFRPRAKVPPRVALPQMGTLLNRAPAASLQQATPDRVALADF
eukprot:TRINITY_DN91043_c0_g1_i1.p1 TRINITY_DN91043_c0_g1~~TRINITY_DN91043_c0_g1_i1.p1  ORF type:complete len:322 (+),score=94.09 TRINITY_DN91043_c0_g1_i1:186-1151(+)